MVQKEMVNNASAVLFRRMPYYLSPQLDIYEKLGPFVRGKNVLEVGFGTGIGVLQYAKNAKWVRAIEIDPAAVRFAKQCFPIENVHWSEDDIIKDAERMPDHDFVVMIEVLEHVSAPVGALANIRTLLKLRGHALITVPSKHRERKKDDLLILHEWNALSFQKLLSEYFDTVRFLDYELHEITGFPNPKSTPIICLCS